MHGGPEFQVDSKRPQPSDTPFWMRHIFGSVADEFRILLGLFIILTVVATLLSIFASPAASQVWDIVKAMMAGGAGGGLVARSVRRR
jgi:hypothetical protein